MSTVVPPPNASRDVDLAFADLEPRREEVLAASRQVAELDALGVDARGRPVGPANPGVKVGPMPMLAPAKERLEQAHRAYDLAWATYQEAARARDARAAEKVAEANLELARAQAKCAHENVALAKAQLVTAQENARIADRVRSLTFWVTIAAFAQAVAAIITIVHTWRK